MCSVSTCQATQSAVACDVWDVFLTDGWWATVLFMGFTMINIFLAIIMDSYAEVAGAVRLLPLLLHFPAFLGADAW